MRGQILCELPDHYEAGLPRPLDIVPLHGRFDLSGHFGMAANQAAIT
jgi:hypothetical protein